MIAPINMDDETERTAPDWERIEADYRAGLLSLRAIAARNGLTEGSIRKRARKLEWARDLKARIHAKAEELVRTAVVRSAGPQYATASKATELVIVQDNAQALAHVELNQRKDIARARTIVAGLFAELEAVLGEGSTAELSPDLLANFERTGTRGTLSKSITLPARAATVKALADALRTLVTLERDAWGLAMSNSRDTGDCTPAESGPLLDSHKLTYEEREQLRAMCERIIAVEEATEQNSRAAAPTTRCA